MGLIGPSGNQSLDYNMILEQMRMKRTYQYFLITYKEEYNKINWKNTHT